MKKSKMVVVTVCIMALLFSVAVLGFARGDGEEEEGQLVIGFDAFNVSMTWMKFAHDAMVEEAKRLGVKLIVLDAENEASRQASNMEDLVALGVDGIVANPIDVDSLTPAINKAASEGVAVATFDRAAKAADYVFYVGCDDMQGAIQAIQTAGIDVNDVVITGYDGVPDGLRAVRDGLADCTLQYPIGQAPEVLKRLVKYLEGESPAEKDFEMSPWIITKENLDTGDFYSLIADD